MMRTHPTRRGKRPGRNRTCRSRSPTPYRRNVPVIDSAGGHHFRFPSRAGSLPDQRSSSDANWHGNSTRTKAAVHDITSSSITSDDTSADRHTRNIQDQSSSNDANWHGNSIIEAVVEKFQSSTDSQGWDIDSQFVCKISISHKQWCDSTLQSNSWCSTWESSF